MQDIKLNPHASMRYYVEADKLEAQQTEVQKLLQSAANSVCYSEDQTFTQHICTTHAPFNTLHVQLCLCHQQPFSTNFSQLYNTLKEPVPTLQIGFDKSK